MPTWGFSAMLPSEAMTPLPRYSGYRTVRSSSTWTKPGGPARNEQSHSPLASAVATQTISWRPMNSTIRSLSRPSICRR
jgi:hypothetical protein